MRVAGQEYRTIWLDQDSPKRVLIIDQRQLPHQFVIEKISSVHQMATAIKEMHVRGAGLIGAAAGYGMYLATLEAPSIQDLPATVDAASSSLLKTRPTAVNLAWAVQRQLDLLANVTDLDQARSLTRSMAEQIADEDAAACQKIGLNGLDILKAISEEKEGSRIHILTHCNAGWLAFVDHGSATAPIYAAQEAGIDLHVWVDETRPRNQGARLTAWELGHQGVPHTIIADNTGGHLMQQGMVDLVMTGTDRTTRRGDVANKIGTYLKALAARDNGIPFYVALPSSSFDWSLESGFDVPIEERGAEEVKYIQGLGRHGIDQVLLTPAKSPAANYGFDITPARLITGLITERGVCDATAEGISHLFPEHSLPDRHLDITKK